MSQRIGRMRHRIEIQFADRRRTATGSWDIVWTPLTTRWGSVEPLSGREYISGEKTQGETTHKIVLRYYDKLEVEHRLVHNSRNFEIVSIANLQERERVHVVMGKELVD